MRHITSADKSLLVGDEAADLLIEYAALVAQQATGDRIDLAAIGSDGDDVVATFLLNSGATIVSETTHSSVPEPDNAKAEQYLHTQIARLRGAGGPTPEEVAGSAVWNATPSE